MSTRDYAVTVLASLSEQKMREFIKLFADESLLAKMECEAMENDPNTRRYKDFDEFMREIDNSDL